jgi:hypothetical protein
VRKAWLPASQKFKNCKQITVVFCACSFDARRGARVALIVIATPVPPVEQYFYFGGKPGADAANRPD